MQEINCSWRYLHEPVLFCAFYFSKKMFVLSVKHFFWVLVLNLKFYYRDSPSLSATEICTVTDTKNILLCS